MSKTSLWLNSRRHYDIGNIRKEFTFHNKLHFHYGSIKLKSLKIHSKYLPEFSPQIRYRKSWKASIKNDSITQKNIFKSDFFGLLKLVSGVKYAGNFFVLRWSRRTIQRRPQGLPVRDLLKIKTLLEGPIYDSINAAFLFLN